MKRVLVSLSLLILVCAFDDNTLDDVKKKGMEAIEHLPDNVKQLVPPGFNASNVPSVAEGEELLKERCDRYGTNESFDNAMAAKEDIQFCLKNLIDYNVIKQEIEKAKPTGDLDTVFRKYCRKSPELRGCVTNFTSSIEPCLSPDERGSKVTITNITDALISFICFKEGDRIALFIAEGGPECLQDKQEEIQQCLNSTFSHYMPKEMPNKEDSLPLLTLGLDECKDITKLQTCVVTHLEKCSEPTPANIVDSMFNFVRKVTPCQKFESSNSASSFSLQIVLIMSAAVAALLAVP